MSIDPKKFGLSDSLVNAVNEALKGNQHKIDVAEPKGKITGADFKKLRGEGAKPDFLDLDKDGNKKEPMKHAAKQVKEEVEQVDEISDTTLKSYRTKAMQHSMSHQPGDSPETMANRNRKTRNRSQGVRTSWNKMIGRYVKVGGGGKKTYEEVEQTDEAMSPKQKAHSNRLKNNPGRKGTVFDPKSNFDAPNHKVDVVVSKDDKKETKQEVVQAKDKHDAMFKVQMKFHKMGYKVHDTKHKGMVKEEAIAEADDAVAKQIAAKKDAVKKQIQQKIAQKQMSAMQAKANKRLSNINASSHDDKEMKKGGKEQIVVNPPLKEASNLPKAVVSKGHEIAKSLIKHRSKVKEPYAVGMAAAKKSAGIKEDAEQVDEISTMKAVRTAVKRQTNAYGDAIMRGDDLSDKEKHKVNRSQALIKNKYGEKGDKIVYKAVGKRIGYQD